MSKMGFETNRRIIADYKCQAGWAVVGGQRYYFRCKLERRWAEYLQILKDWEAILDWEYEPRRFEFANIRSGTVFYTPDFRITEKDKHYWHEVKGHLHQKDVTKFRRMAKRYPDEKIILVMQAIPMKWTRKGAEKMRRLKNARKYVYRIINGTEILKKFGL